MAFSIAESWRSDECDCCRKVKDEPVLRIEYSTRTKRSVIYVHLNCLKRRVEMIEKEINKESSFKPKEPSMQIINSILGRETKKSRR